MILLPLEKVSNFTHILNDIAGEPFSVVVAVKACGVDPDEVNALTPLISSNPPDVESVPLIWFPLRSSTVPPVPG
jgi:hypothetical protein